MTDENVILFYSAVLDNRESFHFSDCVVSCMSKNWKYVGFLLYEIKRCSVVPIVELQFVCKRFYLFFLFSNLTLKSSPIPV